MYEFLGTLAIIILLIGVYFLIRDKYFSDKINIDNKNIDNKEVAISKLNDKLITDKEAYEKALDDFNSSNTPTDGNSKN